MAFESAKKSLFPRLAVLLAAFAAAAYGSALNLPFVGDDYVFLDKTRDARFVDLWSLTKSVDFGWYRPWSREVHFWVLQRLAGLHEAAYRAVGVLLWIIALGLYAAVVQRLVSRPAAVLASLGAASLALWGSPLLWISGSQDLWMLSFAMASMLLFVSGRTWWALLPFALALVSKEISAVLPALLFAFLVLVERRSMGVALQKTAPFVALVLVWLLAHPTLSTRLFGGQTTMELQHRPAILAIPIKTILSTFNLDLFLRPQLGRGDMWRALASVVVLVLGATLLLQPTAGAPTRSSAEARGPLLHFATLWMAVGWFPLLLPSIGWHAYYGCLGALGAWMLIALWLQDHRRIAVGLIACLAILRGAHAATPSWDWGNEWYQRRAGNMLAGIRDDLHQQHPILAPNSRVFFGHIPNNIGLIAGQSPAIRVWYRDKTLQANFYSSYRPRSISEPAGDDLFFRFDSLAGMVEVKAGPEEVRGALASNPQWESDHEKLAVLFVRNGDVPRAAGEFEKLSLLHHRADAAAYAGICREFVGDTIAAESLFAAAQGRLSLSRSEMRKWTERLRKTAKLSTPYSPPS